MGKSLSSLPFISSAYKINLQNYAQDKFANSANHGLTGTSKEKHYALKLHTLTCHHNNNVKQYCLVGYCLSTCTRVKLPSKKRNARQSRLIFGADANVAHQVTTGQQ
jgi:hypothetical protein